jgi:putative DNA primase/helicase
MQLPERALMLSPWLPEKSLGMLYAPRGVGKTYLALSIAVAVATGTKLLKWTPDRPRRVLYVDGEMPARTVQERLKALLAALPPDAPQYNLEILSADLREDGFPDLGTSEGQQWLETSFGAKPLDLLILDNLSCLATALKDNEGQSWQSMQDWLLRLRRQGVSVLFLHHAGKGGQQRGTSRREDVLDVVVALRRPADYEPNQGARFELHFEKVRGSGGALFDPLELMPFARPDDAFEWDHKLLVAVIEERVRELLAEEMSIRAVADELGITAAKVQRIKKKLSKGAV